MTPIRYLTALLATALLVGLLPARATAQEPDATPTATPTEGPSGADLAEARARLKELEEDITAGETGAKRLQTQLRELSYQVSNERGTLAEIEANLNATATRMKSSKERLASIRRKVRDRARSLYKQGPGSLIGVVLGSENLSDFVGRMHFANRLAEQDEVLVLQTRKRRAELEAILEHQERLEEQQRATVQAVTDQQEQILDVFARQQAILAQLAQALGQALRLVARLEKLLGTGEFAAIKRVAGRGMTISYGEWAERFLRHIGAPVVRDNLVAVVAWEASEGTQATWNPLATTMPMEGATVYNSHGVRNYKSLEQGLDAVVETLSRPNYGYEKILDRLEKGAEAMDTGKAINESHWCRGCTEGQYVIGIIPAVERYYERYAGE